MMVGVDDGFRETSRYRVLAERPDQVPIGVCDDCATDLVTDSVDEFGPVTIFRMRCPECEARYRKTVTPV